MEDREAAELAKALGHPLRVSLLRALREQTTLSPSRFAMTSGEALGNVSYHFRALQRVGVVEIVETKPQRGAVEHHYGLQEPRAKLVLGMLDQLGDA